jgi:hypothetical protein
VTQAQRLKQRNAATHQGAQATPPQLHGRKARPTGWLYTVSRTVSYQLMAVQNQAHIAMVSICGHNIESFTVPMLGNLSTTAASVLY